MALGLLEYDDQAVDDPTDPGEEPEEQVDPEVCRESHFESHGEGWDEDREDDHEDFVFCGSGHCLRLLYERFDEFSLYRIERVCAGVGTARLRTCGGIRGPASAAPCRRRL